MSEKEKQILEAARRVAAADRACAQSIELHPRTGEHDTEEGRIHWQRACRERDAAVAALVAAVDAKDAPCTTCNGSGRVPLAGTDTKEGG